MSFYKIPIRLDQTMRGKHMELNEDIRKSIHENINLILRTFSLSYGYDPSFGSLLNKYHAATPPQSISERVWREKMRESIQRNLKEMLTKYETRIAVKDLFIDMNRPRGKDNSVVNVKVQITGNLTLGRREKFHYPDSEVSSEAQEVLPLMIPVGKMK